MSEPPLILWHDSIQAGIDCRCGKRQLVLDVKWPTTCPQCGRRYKLSISASVEALPRPGVCADGTGDSFDVVRL
jgi:hypothetical protein